MGHGSLPPGRGSLSGSGRLSLLVTYAPNSSYDSSGPGAAGPRRGAEEGRPALPCAGVPADDGLMLENNAFRALDRRECLRLLAEVPVGRVVYTRQALPAVLPINFSLDADASVLLFTSAGSDLMRAIDGVVVAFEADEFDAETRSGWSVVVTGRATAVTDPAEHQRLSRTGRQSWMPVRDGVFVRIESTLVTGRELTGARTVQ
jgi:nitroimidazol reductase NimA-like FMN-containing flavoprotein (pyridoxamine 5'-phosphate oxidase superfamily)